MGEIRQQASRALKQARQDMLEGERRISDLQQLVRTVPCLSVPPGSGSWSYLAYVSLVLRRPSTLHGFMTGPGVGGQGEDGAAAGCAADEPAGQPGEGAGSCQA